MKNIKKFLSLLAGLVFYQIGLSQTPFQEQNVSYVYNINAELMFDHLISFQEANNFRLLFTLSMNSKLEVPFDSLYKITAVYKEDYKSEDVLDSLVLPISDILINDDSQVFYFQILGENKYEAELLELFVTNKIRNRDYVFDVSLNEGLEYGNNGLVKYKEKGKLPLFRNFINSGEPFLLENEGNDSSNVWVYYYGSNFEIAVPPMIVDYKSSSKSLSVNELFSTQTDSLISFTNAGLYFVQKDTSSLEGVGFRVEEKPFPKLGSYEKLYQPLKYISTKEEFDDFETGTDLEKKFQRFWIEKSESEAAAKNSISNFYKRVAEANFFFTGYKEGWKTDMGMIYIIYGAPSRVFRHEEYEEWVFHQSINLPALRFTFVKIKNVFSDNHYTLVRDKKFDKHWFRAVELWRTGKK